MSGAGAMDLRYPIGGLFVALGVILAGWGAATAGDAAMYERTAGLNVNLWWGLVMLVVGLVFLGLARRGGRRALRTTAEGVATEERERAMGLER